MLTTRDRLIRSGIELLSAKWLSEVSVADICRHASLSNGVFYRYFNSKEQLFLELLDRYYQVLVDALSDVRGLTGEEGIQKLCTIVFFLNDTYRDLTNIYREGQYRYIEFEERINRLYEKVLADILGRYPSRAESIYIMAGIRFTAFRRTYHQVEVTPETVTQLLTRGIFATEPPQWKRVFEIEIMPLPIPLEQTTEQLLLDAGKHLFGQSGFHDVNIHQVTQRAGVSVGTFYNYFDSKEVFFEHVIRLVSRDLRYFITSNLRTGLSQLEQELQGMVLFGFYISSIDPSCYNIVREGEFVTPSAVEEYYDAFSRGYEKRLDDLRSATPKITGNILMGLSHYFGLTLLQEQRNANNLTKSLIRELATMLTEGVSGL